MSGRDTPDRRKVRAQRKACCMAAVRLTLCEILQARPVDNTYLSLGRNAWKASLAYRSVAYGISGMFS